MPNAYYNNTPGLPRPITRGDATQLQNEFAKIAAGFGEFPDPARLFTNSSGFVVDTGGPSAFFLSDVPGVTSYLDGMEVLFRAANTVTGPATINVNGMGAKTVNRAGGASLQSGDIAAGQIVSLRYNATTDTFQFLPSSASVATGMIDDAATTSGKTWSSSRIVSYGAATYAAIGHTHAGAYAPVGHTHTSAGITDFASAVNALIASAGGGGGGGGGVAWSSITGKPTTAATLGIPDVGLPVVVSSAQSAFPSATNQMLVLTNPTSTFVTLPAVSLPTNSTICIRIRFAFTNGRVDNKLWGPSGSVIKAGNVDVGQFEWIDLDVLPLIVREVVFLPAAGVWFFV